MNSTVERPSSRAPVANPAIRVDAIDHVNLSVADLERAMRFYQEVFGFRVAEDGRSRTEAPYVIMSAGGRAFLALHEHPDAGRPSRPFVNHWGFVVGDLDAVRRRLDAHDIAIQGADTESGGIRQWAHSRSIYVYDPDGHEIELAEVFGGGMDG